jgi:hypothetical protein
MTKLPWGAHCAIGRTRSPEAIARRKEREHVRRLKDKETTAAMRASGVFAPAYSRAPPDHVLAERDRAIAAPRDLNAVLSGDPLPGRSALDRRT